MCTLLCCSLVLWPSPCLGQQQSRICCSVPLTWRVSEPEENKSVNLYCPSPKDWGRQSRQNNLDRTNNYMCCLVWSLCLSFCYYSSFRYYNTKFCLHCHARDFQTRVLYFKWYIDLLKCNDHYPTVKKKKSWGTPGIGGVLSLGFILSYPKISQNSVHPGKQISHSLQRLTMNVQKSNT